MPLFEENLLGNIKKPPKVLIVGSYPPPFGGVTIHIQRLAYHLNLKNLNYQIIDVLGKNHENTIEHVIFEQNPFFWFIKEIFSTEDVIIHSHLSSRFGYYAMGILGFLGKKIILSIHGEGIIFSYGSHNFIRTALIKFSLENANHLIVANSHISDFCLSIGVKSEKISVIPAYIPPIQNDSDLKTISNEIWDFLREHNPVVSANAFTTDFFNNEDLYGIDMCIDLCHSLKKKWGDIGVVFFLPQIRDKKYYETLLQKIRQYDIESNFLFITSPIPEIYPIIMKSDIFVRPTNTDGDSISVREALSFGIPVVASDCTLRPEGVITFKTRDIIDFTIKVIDNLENNTRKESSIIHNQPSNTVNQIIKIYQSLLVLPPH